MVQFHIGVPLFFVLSGFLITLRYYDSSEMTFGWLSRYFRNRVARIYPVYFLLTVTTLLIQKQRDPFYWILNLTFLPEFLNKHHFQLPQAWTLGVEECFYVSAPLIFLLLKRKQNILFPFFSILLMGTGLHFFGRFIGHSGNFETWSLFFSRTYFGRCFEFFCGIALAKWVLTHGGLSSVAVRRGFKLTLCGGLGILGVATAMSFLPPSASSLDLPAGLFLNNLGLPVFVVSLIYGLLIEKNLFQAFLQSPLMSLLGKSSYAFYLVHMGFIPGLLLGRLGLNTFESFVLMVLASVLIFKAFEEPMQELIKRRGIVVTASARQIKLG